ncbi:hypothetical protein NG831_06365 [Xanthomonas sacchari]|uniref:hypothetical protein n=1 Tax=Xanthomonas sacchari TaxID=56458 RepID=UPI002257D926|nr:hypothetical protein [Xanthomonas sacchari]MCW0413512.1 hypothetical protein [Xanthomonas sacchari]UYK67783.1 hypothetical protein NG831_06365 [Xanthomonas sacchari]
MSVVMFPVQDKDQLRRLQTAREVAVRTGWDVRSTEQWMIENNCSQIALNFLSELGREIRMQQNIGEMA